MDKDFCTFLISSEFRIVIRFVIPNLHMTITQRVGMFCGLSLSRVPHLSRQYFISFPYEPESWCLFSRDSHVVILRATECYLNWSCVFYSVST